MCDWGGGPNEMANYLRDIPPRPKEYRTIKCLVYMGSKQLDGSYNCGQPIENFSGSITYWEWDDAVQEHLINIHPNHHMIRR